MIETVRQRDKREKALAAERAARQKRYLQKHDGGAKAKPSDGLLTKEEARLLTKRIVDASEGLAELLLKAHRGEAWKALGYDSWRSYAMAEFKFSQRRVYQLLNHAEVVQEIKADLEIAPLVQTPSERVTRNLVGLTKSVRRKVVKAAVKSSPKGRLTAKTVAAAVVRITKPKAAATKTVKLHGETKNSPYLRQLKALWQKHARSVWFLASLSQRYEFIEWLKTSRPR